MAFFVHRSNRLDLLVQALAQVVREPAQPLEPLRPETIVVQSRALGRYLSYSLARTLGVWACPEFPFPRRTIDLVLGAVLGDSAEAELSVFTEARMTWALARTIPKCLEEEPEVFSPVRQYLTVETGPWPVGTRPNAEEAPRPVGARLMSLSAQLAAVFDRYLAYRPEWILAWDRAPEEHWQSRLWHRLVRDYTSPGAPRPSHLAARAQAFFEAVGDLGAPPEGLAPRLHLFGIRTLSPLFLRIFASLGHVVELHFYHLAPSSEYFADLRPSDLLSEAGSSNPLLGSMGRLGRDLQDMLEEHDYEEAGSSFLDPAPELALLTNVERESSHPALAVVQSDVLHLRSRRPGDASGARPLLLRPDDRSISVHACFGPMREVEALRDQLLAAFEELPGLSPR
ncbi:MAG: exodeoxyribonuclease V subunit gamma, partial [Polyangia bacterium]|nr:exodeoxyribonuclease V subunit gamma [Polyangia bacterium]